MCSKECRKLLRQTTTTVVYNGHSLLDIDLDCLDRKAGYVMWVTVGVGDFAVLNCIRRQHEKKTSIKDGVRLDVRRLGLSFSICSSLVEAELKGLVLFTNEESDSKWNTDWNTLNQNLHNGLFNPDSMASMEDELRMDPGNQQGEQLPPDGICTSGQH